MSSDAPDGPPPHDAASLVVGRSANLHMTVHMARPSPEEDHIRKKQVSDEKSLPNIAEASARFRARKKFKEQERTQASKTRDGGRDGQDGNTLGTPRVDVVGT